MKKHFCVCGTQMAKLKGTKSVYVCPKCGKQFNTKRINELSLFWLTIQLSFVRRWLKIEKLTKINLEKFFETKYAWIENYIRETQGDIGFDLFLDAILDYFE